MTYLTERQAARLAERLADLPQLAADVASPISTIRHREEPRSVNNLPICDWSGLQRLWCPPTCPQHGNHFTLTADERALLDGQLAQPVLHSRTLERAAAYRPTSRTIERRGDHTVVAEHVWKDETPQPVRCDNSHTPAPGQQICHDCADRLERALGDIPALVSDLQLARRKAVRFVPHAYTTNPDEAPIPWNDTATSALIQLAQAVAGEPVWASRWWLTHWRKSPHQQALLEHVTRAVSWAHHVIDRPRDRVHAGTCPQCGADLEAERGQHVTCPHGDYATSWEAHLRHVLAASEDRLFTVSELVAALGIDRNQVKNLTRRMAGQTIDRPHLDGHAIVSRPVTVYRLGDVRDVARERGWLDAAS